MNAALPHSVLPSTSILDPKIPDEPTCELSRVASFIEAAIASGHNGGGSGLSAEAGRTLRSGEAALRLRRDLKI